MRLGLLAALLLLAAPAEAQRAMGATMCACPGRHKPLGSAATCEEACYGSSGGGGGGTSIGTELGTAIGAGIAEAMRQSAARQKALAEQNRLNALRLQEQRRQEDEARKQRLLDGMQGVESSSELSLMMGDEPVRESQSAIASRAQGRHNEEAAQRRAALARLAGKPEEKWCKLHLPQAVIMPQRPLNDVMGRYPSMLEKFGRDRAEWDGRCGGPSAGGPTPLDRDLAALERGEPAKREAPAAALPPLAYIQPAAAPASAPEPALQAGGMALMADEDLPPPAPPPPAPVEETVPAAVVAADLPLEPFKQQQAQTPELLSTGPAPAFPASFGAQDVAVALAPGSGAAAPDAFEYMRRAGGYVAQQGKQLNRELIKKTAKKAVSAEYGLASILINMHDLPELIGPKIVRASNGELPLDEANLLLFESVNVLYNVGAAPNKVVAKMIEKKDAIKGLVAWGVDAAADKSAAMAGRGIAAFAAQAHADYKFPQIEALKGSNAGAVDALLHQGNRYVVEKDIRRASVKAKEVLVIARDANKAIRWDEP